MLLDSDLPALEMDFLELQNSNWRALNGVGKAGHSAMPELFAYIDGGIYEDPESLTLSVVFRVGSWESGKSHLVCGIPSRIPVMNDCDVLQTLTCWALVTDAKEGFYSSRSGNQPVISRTVTDRTGYFPERKKVATVDGEPLYKACHGKEALCTRFKVSYGRLQMNKTTIGLGIEARGFIFGPPIALAIGAKFVPLRKPKKLPGKVISQEYILEYGRDCLEMHVGAVEAGERAIVVDDLIATGGTLCAAMDLLERVGAEVVECACVIELPELKGRERLNGKPLYVLVEYLEV
ncbi:Adenine phosphoribosyltransferase [Arachis hypogaea]|nr:Adenine phosphoribosyltransferase [Arachis hypogaea]